jgi:hypothetical protein
MVPFSNFPEMVGGVEVDPGLTWDFKLPAGVTLTGTPTVTVTVYEHSDGADATPQDRLVSAQVGTALNGTTNCAVIAKFGPPQPDVNYLFTVSCARSDSGVAACFNKMFCPAPG